MAAAAAAAAQLAWGHLATCGHYQTEHKTFGRSADGKINNALVVQVTAQVVTHEREVSHQKNNCARLRTASFVQNDTAEGPVQRSIYCMYLINEHDKIQQYSEYFRMI